MAYTVMMVVAAGSSTRMGQPKQHMLLRGKPVLLRTLLTLQAVEAVDELLLVTRAEDIEHFTAMANAYGITKLRQTIAGGATRQQSVWRGLQALPAETTLIGIHDGARPLVEPAAVEAVIARAAETGAAILAVPVRDSVKQTDGTSRIQLSLDRRYVWRGQTPQVFARDAYCDAMREAMERGADFVDDCELMEQAGHTVEVVAGSETNMKITVPEDIPLAEAILMQKEKEATPVRIGHGYDVHRLTEGRPLILGGVTIPWSKGLLGHSDADVLAHAVMDALLGAAALGDIGGLFPDTDPAYAGADSLALLARVAQVIDDAGYTIGNIDATVLAQAPKLKPHIPLMRQRLADACGISPDRVSVKATTEEGLGFTGVGEGIAAHAVCLLEK